MLMFGCLLLLVNGLATSQIVADSAASPHGPAGRVPAELAGGGPIVTGTGSTARGLELPPRTLALAFDDGAGRR